MSSTLHQLYEKEMSRSDFLKYLGVVFLSVIGVTGLMRAVLQTDMVPQQMSGHGYGTSAYGGAAEGR